LTVAQFWDMAKVEAAPSPDVAVQPHEVSALCARVQAVRLLIQLFGVIVCVLFVAQGAVVCLAHYQDMRNIWQWCRWLADGCLYITVAISGCILELRVLAPRVRFRFHAFAVNRFAAATIYIWMGSFAMGGRVASDIWETLGHVTGILAWLVGIANVMISCCSERSERPYNEDRDKFSDIVPEALKQPGRGQPISDTQHWLGASVSGSIASSAPAESPKVAGESENLFAERETKQPPMVRVTASHKQFDEHFAGLVGI